MKKAIYTAVFNNYDSIKRPKYVNEDYDYVLFVDEQTYKKQFKAIQGSIFDVRRLEDGEDPLMQSKDIKINPHKYLSEYDYTIYIDGSFMQVGDVSKFTSQSKKTFQTCKHPRRNCAYEEALVCIRQGLDYPPRMQRQMKKYEQEGFPKSFGLCMGGIISRKNNKKCNNINDAWWNEIKTFSRRDQLSINYVLWKLKEKIGVCEYSGNIDKVFKIYQHI
jgi:hypothetical protein